MQAVLESKAIKSVMKGEAVLPMTQKVVNLSASSLGFGWSKCKRCFYLEERYGIEIPKTSPFAQQDKSFKVLLNGLFSGLYQSFPAGEFLPGARYTSEEFTHNGVTLKVVAQPDDILQLADGSCIALKYKAKIGKMEAEYGVQFNAIAFAMRHSNKPEKRFECDQAGFILYDMEAIKEGIPAVECCEYHPIVIDEDTFIQTLKDICNVLHLTTPPNYTDGCPVCKRDKQIIEIATNMAK